MPVKSSKLKAQSSKVIKPRTSLSAPIYSLLGRLAGSFALPKEIFGAEVNQKLLTQALRVYSNNQKAHFANTKDRGEVHGTTAKVWRQKGTGRARHGARTAPIFVGGGVALGPKFRSLHLELPQKMKRKALICALSSKAKENEIKIISGLEKSSGKTREMARLLNRLNQKSKNTLIVSDGKMENAARAISNISSVKLLNNNQLNVFEVIKHESLILTKEAVNSLQERLSKNVI